MGEAVVKIDDGLVHGCLSLVLATHLNTAPRSRIPLRSFAGEASVVTGRRLDQGALLYRRAFSAAPRKPSGEAKPRAGVEDRSAPACARDQAADEVIRIGGLRNHAPAPMATTSVSPCRTRPSASAANSQLSEPVSCSASHPPTMATNMRRKPADSGQNNRPAPCDAK